MDLTLNLAPSYRDLKDPTTRHNFDDTPGQIPKLILTLRHIQRKWLIISGIKELNHSVSPFSAPFHILHISPLLLKQVPFREIGAKHRKN